ncbi:MAG: mannose-1-phosphate guanylyltransferase/mannose-6-phosphate isomerase [Rhizobiales bacterium]|nr:mannose-1-phosphate guanylyltransferase/mannose-6-phosphate isomerase [Hyphomicrobiales bacterium]
MSLSTLNSPNIYPVILCGGSGSRLWPLSREERPKQFQQLFSEYSMLQETVKRVSDSDVFQAPVIVTDKKFWFIGSDQLADIGVEPGLTILEPQRRNTAAAIALAALAIEVDDPEGLMLVLPSDHLIRNSKALHIAAQMGARAAAHGSLVTFGTPANRPEIGYGYIRQGKKLAYGLTCFEVDAFIEKPDLNTAGEMLETGGHFWNSGIFMFKAKKILDELQKYAPDILEHCVEAFQTGSNENGLIKPSAEAFSRVPYISIDHAVMEKTKDAVVVTIDIGWKDIGSWQSLAECMDTDDAGNAAIGDTIMVDCSGLHVHGSDRLIAAVGLDNLVIVDTADALLVMRKECSQDVRKVVAQLKHEDREVAKLHRKVYRPWGSYEGVHWGLQHQVKHIVVAPGEKLSLQYHHHRSEHWTIVRGVAEVTLDDDVLILKPDESVYIPLGAVHRIYNPGTAPVHLIEVQVGTYLGEDDIVRLEDIYGRVEDTSAPLAAE